MVDVERLRLGKVRVRLQVFGRDTKPADFGPMWDCQREENLRLVLSVSLFACVLLDPGFDPSPFSSVD